MSIRLIPLAAAVALAAVAPPARAADAVYGGTSDGEPIAITANKAVKKLTSAVVTWSATCDDGRRFPFSAELTPAADAPGFTPGLEDLAMARNGRGRFKGTTAGALDVDAGTGAALMFAMDGRLGATRAAGTLSGTVKIFDKATGNAIASCETGTQRWAASRAPGKVFAGKTSQEQPVVVRADSRRHKVGDVLMAWQSQNCTPTPQFVRFPEHFGNFPLARSGAFGAPFSADYPMDAGGKATFAYRLAGRVTRTAARGTFRAAMATIDAAGAQTEACDSGAISWKARTG